MGLPSKRTPRSRTRRRRSHHALGRVNTSTCPKCAEPSMPHRACSACGTYRGRQVTKPKTPSA